VPQVTAAPLTAVVAAAARVTWVADWLERTVVARPPPVPAPSTEISLPTSAAANLPEALVSTADPEVMAPSATCCPSTFAP
jgi:hypothetical protein